MDTSPPMRELNPTGTHIPSDGELLGRAMREVQALQAENERLRGALTRILDAFYSRNGLNNTHLLDAMEDADRV